MDKYNLKDIEYVEKLILNKQYTTAMLKLNNFVISHHIYIKSRLEKTTNTTINLDNFLKRCGEDSYTAIRMNYCSFDDNIIINDIKYCIYLLMLRYKKQDRYFIGYLSNAFAYEYGRLIFESLKEITTRSGVKTYYDNINANLSDYRDDIDFKLGIISGVEDIDFTFKESWLTYKDEESVFNCLNQFERKIILEYFQENKPSVVIAKELNKHINTISMHKNNAIKKLEKKLNIKYKRQRRNKKA